MVDGLGFNHFRLKQLSQLELALYRKSDEAYPFQSKKKETISSNNHPFVPNIPTIDFQVVERMIIDPKFNCKIHILEIREEPTSKTAEFYVSKMDFWEYLHVNPGK